MKKPKKSQSSSKSRVVVSPQSKKYSSKNKFLRALSPAQFKILAVVAFAFIGGTIVFAKAATPSPSPLTTVGGGNKMIVGIAEGVPNGNGSDISKAVNYVRIDLNNDKEPASYFSNYGVKVDYLLQGPYNSGGVAALGNPTTWAKNALGWYKSSGCNPTICPIIEVLNEPGGSWFWGSDALSSANSAAYGALVKATYTTFSNYFGSSRPVVLASYDGGYSGNTTWGQEVGAAFPSIGNYVDGITVHPYGGVTDAALSAQGNRANVQAAYSQTGKPVYITEVGWPTAVGQPATGDSLQWTQAQQCNNIYNFIAWARNTNYVNEVAIFNYEDFGTNDFYGIATSSGVHKPSFLGIKAAALKQPNTCPAS